MPTKPLDSFLGDQFKIQDAVVFGCECSLITPKDMGVDWNEENKGYRSILIRKSDNKVVSRSWRKFVNFGEKPDFEPWNPDWQFDARAKIDGSALILSKMDGNVIARTRGTSDARMMKNGDEVDYLLSKYPKLIDNELINSENYSILCEWVTPTNRIVVNESDEPDLILLGAIENESGEYVFQLYLDGVAEQWNIRRPKRYFYPNLGQCLDDVKRWKDKEGLVLYHEPTQTLKKIKADEYLRLHRLKSHISSISNLVEFYMTTERAADYNEFFKVIEQALDFELALQAKNDIEKVCFTHECISIEARKVEWFVDGTKHLPRKDFAAKVIDKYADWRKSYSFMVLDNKKMPDQMLKTLLIDRAGA